MENDAQELALCYLFIKQFSFSVAESKAQTGSAGTKINCYPWKCLYCT